MAFGVWSPVVRLQDIGVRAEPYEYGAPEAVNLELYLMSRTRGMPLETPGVRAARVGMWRLPVAMIAGPAVF